MQVLFANVFLSPHITFVLEVPGARQNGSLAAKGNINICLGNQAMSALFALRVDPRGQEAGLTTPLSFLRNWVGQEPCPELQAFFRWQTGERAFVPLKDQDTQ